MEQFTGQNLNNLLAFLNRVQLSGEEAIAMVELQQKIRGEMARRTAAKTAIAPAPEDPNTPEDMDPTPIPDDKKPS